MRAGVSREAGESWAPSGPNSLARPAAVHIPLRPFCRRYTPGAFFAVMNYFVQLCDGLAHVHAKWLSVAAIREDGRLSMQRLQTFEKKRAAGPIEPYAECMELERVIGCVELDERPTS